MGSGGYQLFIVNEDTKNPKPRNSKGKPSYEALLVDVGGTLLETSKPVASIYAELGLKYGLKKSPDEIKTGFKKAFAAPWPERLRYEGDGKPFWRFAVATATGCRDESYFEELYQGAGNRSSLIDFSVLDCLASLATTACEVLVLFGRRLENEQEEQSSPRTLVVIFEGEAWRVSAGAQEALVQLREAGVKLAVVSNFDSRLRPVLQDLQVYSLFDAIIVSSEIGFEKPARQIFEAALSNVSYELKVGAEQAVHVGDDATADKAGAEALGIKAWLWKKDVKSFKEVAGRILNADAYPEGS
ncbi:hypothetical protein AXG93_3911s1220 [Marchantia polymorpha subsp. ruderalis]|uniref:Haloacid dehalogenase-like hydrolase domain-containing protein 3 n=1 Tax=Marchantia polymorpha subsp. ruderalis TaxID=1480154 RepID=A0A176W328_MARPO|nr:hypothetical protein AXG93_3911s1220 [Marchantia polymorpha subsp. ruderalis]